MTAALALFLFFLPFGLAIWAALLLHVSMRQPEHAQGSRPPFSMAYSDPQLKVKSLSFLAFVAFMSIVGPSLFLADKVQTTTESVGALLFGVMPVSLWIGSVLLSRYSRLGHFVGFCLFGLITFGLIGFRCAVLY